MNNNSISTANLFLKKFFFGVFVFALFSIAASAQGEMMPMDSLIDSQTWVLVKIKNKSVPKDSKAFITINTAEKRLGGNGGCNHLFGTVEINGNRIKISEVGSTKMFCTEAGVMMRENELMNYLEKSTRYVQTGRTLSLYAGRSLLLKFKAKDKVSSGDVMNLDEKKWMLTAIESKALPNTPKIPYFVFNKTSGKFTGNFGCNSGSGKYETNGEKILFKDIIQTEMACGEPAASIERQFTDALSKANRFKMEEGKLLIFFDEKLLLTLKAAN